MSNLKSTILRVVGPSLLSKASVTANRAVGANFRMIEIASESLRNVAWKPGAKVQINTGDWKMRTYTPVEIDAATGVMQVLAYVSNAGPGSNWAESAQAGASTNFKGPDGEMRITTSGPLTIFGDETAFGLALGFRRSLDSERTLHFVFEVSSLSASHAVLSELGISDAHLFPKNEGDGVHPEPLAEIMKRGEETGSIVLAGRAQSIQEVRAKLKAAGAASARLITKVYWSRGKAGLD